MKQEADHMHNSGRGLFHSSLSIYNDFIIRNQKWVQGKRKEKEM